MYGQVDLAESTLAQVLANPVEVNGCLGLLALLLEAKSDQFQKLSNFTSRRIVGYQVAWPPRLPTLFRDQALRHLRSLHLLHSLHYLLWLDHLHRVLIVWSKVLITFIQVLNQVVLVLLHGRKVLRLVEVTDVISSLLLIEVTRAQSLVVWIIYEVVLLDHSKNVFGAFGVGRRYGGVASLSKDFLWNAFS